MADSLFCRNPQTLHLAIQVAALETEHFRGAADVAMILVQLLENVVALICRTCLVQRRTLAARHPPATVAMHQRRKMLALKSRSSVIHDHDALDHIPQFADVPRPGVARQGVDRIVGDLSW